MTSPNSVPLLDVSCVVDSVVYSVFGLRYGVMMSASCCSVSVWIGVFLCMVYWLPFGCQEWGPTT